MIRFLPVLAVTAIVTVGLISRSRGQFPRRDLWLCMFAAYAMLAVAMKIEGEW
jgi:hypothetical protein